MDCLALTAEERDGKEMVILPADRGGVTAAFWIGLGVGALTLVADLGVPIAPALPVAAFAAYLTWRGGTAGRVEAARAAGDRIAALGALIAAVALARAVALEAFGLHGVIPGTVVTDLSSAIVASVTGLALRETLLAPATRGRRQRTR